MINNVNLIVEPEPLSLVHLDYDLHRAATKIQATFRKAVVKKIFLTASTRYDAICTDIESSMKENFPLYSMDCYRR